MTPEEQLEAALAEVERLRAALAEKDVKLASKDEQIKSLQDQLLWLRKKVYGHMSEKHLPIDPLQLNLFEKEHMTDEERAQLAAEMAAAEQTITKTITVKEKPARRDLNTSALPVEECHVYPMGQPMNPETSRMNMRKSALRNHHDSKGYRRGHIS